MQSKILVSVLALGLTLAACSAKVSSPDMSLPANPAVFTHKVAGPALDGRWLSGCELSGNGRGVVYSMTIDGQSVTRVTSEYADAACNQPTKEHIENGMFRFNKQYDAQNFEVEYRITIDHGHYEFAENIRFDGTTLAISNHASGTGVIPHITLKSVN